MNDPLESKAEEKSSEEQISRFWKWGLWYGAWIVVALLMNPVNLPAFIYFPLGLVALFPRGDEQAIVLAMHSWPRFVGWVIYLLFAVGISRTRKRTTFITIYSILCLVLVLNVVGCKKVLEALSGIH